MLRNRKKAYCTRVSKINLKSMYPAANTLIVRPSGQTRVTPVNFALSYPNLFSLLVYALRAPHPTLCPATTPLIPYLVSCIPCHSWERNKYLLNALWYFASVAAFRRYLPHCTAIARRRQSRATQTTKRVINGCGLWKNVGQRFSRKIVDIMSYKSALPSDPRQPMRSDAP